MNISICFPDSGPYMKYHPPLKKPANEDLIYSVSAGQRIAYPIIAFLCEDGEPISPDHVYYSTNARKRYFYIESLPERYVISKSLQADTYNGMLCQLAANSYPLHNPKRFDLDPTFSTHDCSSHRKNVHRLSYIPIHGNMLIAQGLYHTLASVTKRVFQFTLMKTSGKRISAFTNPIEIPVPAFKLIWASAPPLIVRANHPFNITLFIVDENYNMIKSGFDSTLIVEVTVAYYSKLFLNAEGLEDQLFSTKTNMAGDEVQLNRRNTDYILRSRAHKGWVKFINIRILDRTLSVSLNATILVPRTEVRQPDNYIDVRSECLVDRSINKPGFLLDYGLYTYDKGCKMVGSSISLSEPFQVAVQIAAKIVVIQSSESNLTYTANFRIPNFRVEIQDDEGNRIYSGPDSQLPIKVRAFPLSVCLSRDSSFRTKKGIGIFLGSICKSTEDVRLIFYSRSKISKQELVSDPTKPFNVKGDIHLALFARFDVSANFGDIQPNFHPFAQFAVDDINSGKYDAILPSLRGDPNRKLEISFHNTAGKLEESTSELLQIIDEGTENPHRSVKGLIGFGSNSLTLQITPLMGMFDLPLITLRESSSIFSYKGELINTLGWNDVTMHSIIAKVLKLRNWNKIIVITDSKRELPSHFYYVLASSNIEVAFELKLNPNFGDWTRSYWDHIHQVFTSIPNYGTKVIVHFITQPLQSIIYRQAANFGVAGVDGYQWIACGYAAAEFDTHDENLICKQEPKCSHVMQGIMLLKGTFSMLSFTSPQWQRVNRRFFSMDPTQFYGAPIVKTFKYTGDTALAYDAVLSYAWAFDILLQTKKTLYSHLIAEGIHKVTFSGLSGRIAFNRFGRRKGFLGTVRTMGKGKSEKKTMEMRWVILPFIKASSYQVSFRHKRPDDHLYVGNTSMLIEIPTYNQVFNETYIPLGLPVTNITTLRFYVSRSGTIVLPKLNLLGGTALVLRTEVLTAAVSCKGGCGLQLSPTNIIEFDRGVCEFEDECKCKTMRDYLERNTSREMGMRPAFTGHNCELISCTNCRYGSCLTPEKCQCHQGYRGFSCGVPICSTGCVHGTCIGPNVCECRRGYMGSLCSISLLMFVLTLLVSILILLLALLGFLHFYLRRRFAMKLMKDSYWIVNWSEVNVSSELNLAVVSHTTFKKSSMFNIQEDMANEFVKWKEMNCHAKIFDGPSLNVNCLEIRQEISQLLELLHVNVVPFLGACLTAPNVALLTQMMPKGDLHSVLVNPSFKLDWNFKYSFLRDICNGMIYLHASKIGSHGRLKSSNCLVDNQWTCKISGFGAQSFRSRRGVINETVQRKLLWTSPELLRASRSPAEVGAGSKSGDAYSFGIIMTECCTHDLPFAYELQIISIEELLRVLRNFEDASNRGIKKLLDMRNYDTTKPIRPAIPNNMYPPQYEEKQKLKNLISETTKEEASERPSFTKIKDRLEDIHFFEGELVDNLLSLLERYTNHLEEMIVDKLQEAEKEKQRAEEIVKRLLPPSIAEELKLGREVPPQLHNNVSFFQSDIVGFTAISKSLTPMQVVTLLEDLYSCFDQIIDMFKVYKVETIGDAYCVASGIPLPYSNHVIEIASMSLHILSAVYRLPLTKTFGKIIKVRIGIHTGSCVAGLLGQKMPRYCIFGEDVVIAQSMESSGLEQKIHVSSATANLLSKQKQFILKERGLTPIIPVGMMQTFWLVGKQNFEHELPDDEDSDNEKPSRLKIITPDRKQM